MRQLSSFPVWKASPRSSVLAALIASVVVANALQPRLRLKRQSGVQEGSDPPLTAIVAEDGSLTRTRIGDPLTRGLFQTRSRLLSTIQPAHFPYQQQQRPQLHKRQALGCLGPVCDQTIDEIIYAAYTHNGVNVYDHMAGVENSRGEVLTDLDMRLTNRQFEALGWSLRERGRTKRKASAFSFTRWPEGVVPYEISASYDETDVSLIHWAMEQYERQTCVRFRPATDADVDRLVFQDGIGCSSDVGRLGGRQITILQRSCRTRRLVLHELGHVLGLVHEHQRPDRDLYVEVLYENVRPGDMDQFRSFPASHVTSLGVPYDYTSIMHYGPTAFSRSPGLVTMRTRDPRYQHVIGQSQTLSPADVAVVNKMYRCQQRNASD